MIRAEQIGCVPACVATGTLSLLAANGYSARVRVCAYTYVVTMRVFCAVRQRRRQRHPEDAGPVDDHALIIAIRVPML